MEFVRYIDSSTTPHQGMLHSLNQSATGENPVRESAGKLVARSEDRNQETIPTPRFARRPSTMNSFFPAEGGYPQNYMADQTKLQISELHFDTYPTPSTFSCLKIRFKTQVSSCSGFPSEAMLWIKEVEMVDSVDDLESSRSIQGHIHFPNFEMLDARIASALNKIIQNSFFKKKGQSGGTEGSERRLVLSRKTDRLHDLRLLPGCWRSSYSS